MNSKFQNYKTSNFLSIKSKREFFVCSKVNCYLIMKAPCLKWQPKYNALYFVFPYILVVTAAKCVKFMYGLDLILLIATF